MIRVASAPFRGRAGFGDLLNDMGLLGEAVEVGTHRGEFAHSLLLHWRGQALHCVDPWETLENPAQDQYLKHLGSDGDRLADRREAERLLTRFGGRVTIHVETSRDLADRTPDGSVDFVYLDGDHEPPGCGMDIFVWWARLRRGGVLAGHDVVMPGSTLGREDAWDVHVQPALFQFAAVRGLPVYLVPEDAVESPWSYYVVKP